MTPRYVNQGGELNWLLDDLVNRVPQVTEAVMLTQDGLAIGASAGLSREDAPPATSVYNPHPMPTGHPEPAPYTE